jgi:hypothetical protein
MKKIKGSLLFFCLAFSLQALEAKYGRDNDNRYYFYDVAFDNSIFIPVSNKDLSTGTVIALQGSYFLNDKWGFRSGVSYISGLDGSDMYWKVPVLFAFQSATATSIANPYMEFETFRDYLVHFLLNAVPKRFEFNAGLSLGYMTPDAGGLRSRFASSIDANMRIIYPIRSFGLYINTGVSYLWTRNYIHFDYKPYPEESRPAWFANLGVGLSYRF